MESKTKQYTSEMERYRQLKELEKRRVRQERKARQAEENHWKFLAGDLVARYLKDDLKITVYKGAGAREKNKVSFQPLENILAYLSAHKDVTAGLMQGSQPQGQTDLCISGAYTHRGR